MYITGSEFSQNKAKNGGAAYIKDVSMTIDGSEFIANEAKNDGGAIWSNKNSRIIKNSKFIENKALNEAGAIYRGTLEKLQLTNDTFIDNTPYNFDTLTGSFTDLQKLLDLANDKYDYSIRGNKNKVAQLISCITSIPFQTIKNYLSDRWKKKAIPKVTRKQLNSNTNL